MALHERWFTDETRFPVQFDTWATPNSLVPLGVTIIATVIYRARGRQSIVPGPIALGMPWENYVRLLTWVPLVIGVHMGVTLLVSGVSRQLFIPNLVLPENLLGGLLGMVEIAIALSFIYGARASRRRGARSHLDHRDAGFRTAPARRAYRDTRRSFLPLRDWSRSAGIRHGARKTEQACGDTHPVRGSRAPGRAWNRLNGCRLHGEAVEHPDGSRVSIGSSLQLLSVHRDPGDRRHEVPVDRWDCRITRRVNAHRRNVRPPNHHRDVDTVQSHATVPRVA